MEYRPLGRSGIDVSAICLGTMTWGEQNTRDEAFEQMDFAIDHGVTFWDTAEMYAAPPREETYGRTEEIIGEWLASRGRREHIVLASKVAGPSPRMAYIRGGGARLDRANIEAALDASLKRLGTDYLDLYQLHWPERSTNFFGKLGYRHEEEQDVTPIEETLAVLDDLVTAGKVRTVGLSNETAWGVMHFLGLSELGKGPRVVSVQNPYSLLNRSFEAGLAEVAMRENCGLLAYAPIAAGALTGKYMNGERPEGARMTLFPSNKRYFTANGVAATEAYVALAKRHGLDPAVMAGAFVYRQPFLTASIIGATSIAQLETQLQAAETHLSEEVLGDIEQIHQQFTYPCP